MCRNFEFVLRHVQTQRGEAAPAASRRPGPETVMTFNQWIRRTHRWLSIVFTLTVVANFAAMTQGAPPAWITYSPLLPLFLLLFSGLYLFHLPHEVRWRKRAGQETLQSDGHR